MDKANTLLKMKHGIVRLDNVWGVGGGLRPVKVLTKKVSIYLYLPHCLCYLHLKRINPLYLAKLLCGSLCLLIWCLLN